MQYLALLIRQDRDLTPDERASEMAAYDTLAAMTDSPVVRANRALAVGFRDGPEAGLTALEKVAHDPRLARSNLVASVRADLLRRAGRRDDALTWYRKALALSGSEPGQDYLRRRVAELSTPPSGRL